MDEEKLKNFADKIFMESKRLVYDKNKRGLNRKKLVEEKKFVSK